MLRSDSSITTIVGMRGCGKSTLTRTLSKSHPRIIVFDIVEEWQGTHVVNNYEEFKNIWREVFHKDEYTIVVRFIFGTDQKDIIDTQTKITKLIYLTGRDSHEKTCIIFEECQFYFPTHGLHPINMHLLTTGRHAFIDVIANTQRPASISKLLISQSAQIYIGSLYEANDMQYLYDSIGDVAYLARDLQSMEFIYYPIGKPDQISIIQL